MHRNAEADVGRRAPRVGPVPDSSRRANDRSHPVLAGRTATPLTLYGSSLQDVLLASRRHAMTLAFAPTLPDLLRARAEVTPDRTAFSEWGADPKHSLPLTWAEFAARVQLLAAYLASRGIRSGSRVGILAKNSVDWEVANFAIMTCGAVSVGLDVHASDELIMDAIRSTAVEALFSDDLDRVQRVEALGLHPLQLVIAFRSRDQELPSGVVALPDALAYAGDFALVLPNASDGALIVFSSGTSGIPKAIE